MIAKIKTRADFGGIVNYANDQKNKKKSAILLAYEGVCAISNKDHSRFFSDTSFYASESKKFGETRITCFLSARYHPFFR